MDARRLSDSAKPPIAVGLSVILAFAVCTIWSLDFWPTGIVQTGLFALTIWGLFLSPVPRLTWPVSLLIAMIGWQTIQFALHASIYPFASAQSLLGWCGCACAVWLGVQTFDDARAFRIFRRSLLGVAFACSLIAILKSASASDRILWLIETQYSRGAIGLFLNRNYYAAFIELALPLALWNALIRRKRVLLHGAVAATLFASVILSASRTGTALVMLEAAGFLLAPLVRAIRGAGKREYAAAIVSVVLILLTTSLVGWDALVQRFRSNEHLGNRLAFAESSLRMIQDRPLLGFGLGTWPIAYPGYATVDAMAEVNHAHNDWLEWAAEGGIPFALLMILICLRAAHQALRFPWAFGVVSVCVHSLLDFPLQKFPILLCFLLLIAAEEAQARAHKTLPRRDTTAQPAKAELVFDIRPQ